MKQKKDKNNINRSDELYDIFNRLSEEKKKLVYPLIENAIFIEEQLKQLQEIINKDGVIDEYQNGNNQYGKKQSATMQTYNALIKNYNAIINKLSIMLEDIPQHTESPLEMIINKLERELKEVEQE